MVKIFSMNQVKLDAILNAIAHLKHAVTSHTVPTLIVGYVAFVIVILKIFHFMKDKNMD